MEKYNLEQYIEKHYGVNIYEFVELYKEGLSRREIAEKLNISDFVVRTIAALLGLRLKKKFREIDYLRWKNIFQNVNQDEALIEEIKILNDAIHKTSKSLQNCRDENLLLRKQIRLANRVENLYERFKDDIKEELENIKVVEPVKENLYCHNRINKTIICLSDLHIGAFVEKDDVAGSNEFNFELAKQRILKVVKSSSSIMTENLDIVILGDIFDGIIHNSHLIAEMPVAEAVVKFAVFFSEILLKLKSKYRNINVYVVTGNHDRLTDEQNVYKKGYDFTYFFVELLKSLVKNVNITYFINGYGIFKISEKYGAIFHGDIDRTYRSFNEQSQLKVLANIKRLFNVEPILLLSGHTHSYSKSMMYNGGYAITVGSLLGTNSYAFNMGYIPFVPSQCILYYANDELVYEQIVKLDLKDKYEN